MNLSQKVGVLFTHIFLSYLVSLGIFFPLMFTGQLFSRDQYLSMVIVLTTAIFVPVFISGKIIARIYLLDKGTKLFLIEMGLVGLIIITLRFFYLYYFDVDTIGTIIYGSMVAGYVLGSLFIKVRISDTGEQVPVKPSKLIGAINHKFASIKTSPIVILGISVIFIAIVVVTINFLL